MYRILVTGSRDWTNKRVIEETLGPEFNVHPEGILVHGAARGLDTLAARYWKWRGGEVDPHPADWKTYGRAAGRIRNQVMVDLGADVCYAYPLPDSIGTYDCVRRAKEANITTHVVNLLT